MRNLVVLGILLLAVCSCGGKKEHQPDNEPADDMDAQLEKFEARQKYRSLNAEILASIPDSDLEQAVFDYIDGPVLSGDASGNASVLKKLGPGLRMVYSTIILEEEVNGGGFMQFFSNADFLAEDAIAGFSLIGAYSTSGICTRALELVRAERGRGCFSKDTSANLSANTQEELEKLDNEFYKSSEQLSKLRIEYIRKNIPQFTTR